MIFFIEDEPDDHMSSHIDELHLRGYVVKTARDADEALGFFEERYADIRVIVLDIMLPYGERFTASETELGQRTGYALFEHIRRRMPDVPIIVLTNSPDERHGERFRKEPRCEFRRKKDCLPHQLAEIIERMLKLATPHAHTRS